MKYSLMLVNLFIITFSLSANAGTLPDGFLTQHPELRKAAHSLELAHDDWPESEPQVIAHCLRDLKKWSGKKRGLSTDKKLLHFDNCAARWTTVGSLKAEYTD